MYLVTTLLLQTHGPRQLHFGFIAEEKNEGSVVRLASQHDPNDVRKSVITILDASITKLRVHDQQIILYRFGCHLSPGDSGLSPYIDSELPHTRRHHGIESNHGDSHTPLRRDTHNYSVSSFKSTPSFIRLL